MNTRLSRGAILLVVLLLAATVSAQPLTVLWDRSGAGERSGFGGGVYALGDQDDDGFADFAVSSGGNGIPGQINEPRLDFFHGGNPPSAIPYLTFKGRLAPYRELWGRQTIGDVNGDGYIDWWTQYGFGPQDTIIAVEFHWGGPAADTLAEFTFSFSGINRWIKPLGDLNGDGFDDWCFYSGGHSLSEDITFIHFGGSQIDTIPDLVIHSFPLGSQSSLPRAFGDINGDGYGDFVTSTNYWPPTAFLYLGSENPDTIADAIWNGFHVELATLECDLNADEHADMVISWGDTLDVHFGRYSFDLTPDYQLRFPGCDNGAQRIASAGDFNGDGYGDLVAIDPACNLASGGLRLYFGHPWLNPDPVLSIDGRTSPLNLVGIATAAALGDINDDGVDDLAIGATNNHFDGRRGRVVILSGDTTLHVGANPLRAPLPQELTINVYPNPFNSSATFTFTLPRTTPVTLTVFNTLGQRVREVNLGPMAAGEYRYVFDAGGLPSGLYLARVEAAGLTETKKVVLMR